jgi:hypothetical protein
VSSSALEPLALALLLGCSGREEASRTPTSLSARLEPAGQRQDLVSPSGSLRVQVPIVSLEGRDFASWWCPEILDAQGDSVFQDRDCFPARFNVYWAWDPQDGLWLYNTDDGALWRYARGPEGWVRQPWKEGAGQEPPVEIRARLERAP